MRMVIVNCRRELTKLLLVIPHLELEVNSWGLLYCQKNWMLSKCKIENRVQDHCDTDQETQVS